MALTARPVTVPLPRIPFGHPGAGGDPDSWTASWYERELGWSVVGGPPVQLATGERFDVLELPADAGTAVLRRRVATGPVAVMGRRMRFLVAAGSADELEGLLVWLEWGGVALDLAALGAGGRITAPVPPGRPAGAEPQGSPRGTAVWLRPPEQGCEALLPALPAPGQGPSGSARGPDLVRLVAAAATECHRARLRRRTAPAERAGVVDRPAAGQTLRSSNA
ncbi:SCO3374 family protein [Streptomyces sp. NPDC060048]|uniref:SCO3374 family protein n=1 Tax=unclassified Streptomyces TaxID=2593676 RepID=UPI00369CC00C